MKKSGVFTLALVLGLVLVGCGVLMDVSDEDALYELAGRWYNDRYEYAFEITPEGEGYIASDKTTYTMSVLRGIVRFWDSNDKVRGSFSYSIKNGELTMTSTSGPFSGGRFSSPFIKAGTVPSGGTVPVEFIGKWYSKNHPRSFPDFEITEQGRITIPDSEVQYWAILQGNTISILNGIESMGSFQSFFYYGEMFVTNGKDICSGLGVLSPLVKE